MKKNIYTILFLCSMRSAFAGGQNETVLNYIDQYKDIAVEQMYAYHIPASITLAQGIIESGAGLSELAQESNNHFGIKCHEDWKGDKVYYVDDAKDECFRKYRHVEDSYADHSAFLSNNSRYAGLFDLRLTDYKGWAKGLKAAGYATNPKYADMLIDIIETYELDAYDVMSLADAKKNADKKENAAQDKKIKEHRKKNTDAETEDAYFSWNGYGPEVFYFNRIPTITVQQGNTTETIAAANKIKLSQLLKYNDMQITDQPEPGKNFYLQPKRKKGKEKYHAVKENETMWSISRDEGVLLDVLYERNKLVSGQEPAIGEKIYLKNSRKEPPLLRQIKKQEIQVNADMNKTPPGNKDNTNKKKADSKDGVSETRNIKTDQKNSSTAIMVFDTTELVIADTIAIVKKTSPEIKKETAETQQQQITEQEKTPLYHTVQAQETLYSLSKQYQVQTAEIQKWNALSDNSIRIGQQLIVGFH